MLTRQGGKLWAATPNTGDVQGKGGGGLDLRNKPLPWHWDQGNHDEGRNPHLSDTGKGTNETWAIAEILEVLEYFS